MSGHTQFTPHSVQKHIGEGSPLQSKRESQNPLHLNKFHNQSGKQVNSLTQGVQNINRTLVPLYQPRLTGINFYPFKIYLQPSMFRTTSSVDTSWRTVRVRSGAVLTEVISPLTHSLVIGTDNITWPDRQLYQTNFTGSGYDPRYDITVPTNCSFYYFYIETSVTKSVVTNHYQYNLRHTQTPTSASIPNNPHAWTSYPSASSNYTMIGYADSNVSGAIHQLYVRQYLRTDLLSTGGSSLPTPIPFPVCLSDGTQKIYYIYGYESGSI